MNYKFDINLTLEDYIYYNKFWSFKSPYGKGQLASLRIMVAIIGLIGMFFVFLRSRFTLEGIIGYVVLGITFTLLELFIDKLMAKTLSSHIRSLEKKGKANYSAKSTLEFLEDRMSELNENGKLEFYYDSVERISIILGKTVYIHVTNVLAQIIPFSCFNSGEELSLFVDFLKEKCKNAKLDVYKPLKG